LGRAPLRLGGAEAATHHDSVQRSDTIALSTILSVTSGVPRHIADLLDILPKFSKVPIRMELDPKPLRLTIR
jgi:hypothetical protein